MTISVVVVTRSRVTLDRAVESCFRDQRVLPDDEVIVVGAGPQPAARDVAVRRGAAYVEVDPAGGPADWRNRARALPAGDAVFYLDEADVLLGNALELLRSAAAERGLPLVVRGEQRNKVRERAVLARRGQLGDWLSPLGYVQDTLARAGGPAADLPVVAYWIKPFPDRW